jgi:ATP-dependent 26S proteasome regulatory subunit
VEKKQLSGAAVDNIITEITLLKLLKHEYVVEMKDFHWDERFVLYTGLFKMLKKFERKEHSPEQGTT